MAVTDLTTISVEVPGASHPNTLIKTKALRLDLSKNSLGSADTHLIYGVPVGEAFVRGVAFVHTTCAGGTSLQFKMGIDMSTAVTVDSNGLDAGKVFTFGVNSDDVTGASVLGTAQYSVSTELDITMTVVGTMTAGIVYVVIETVDVAALHASSILVGDGLV